MRGLFAIGFRIRLLRRDWIQPRAMNISTRRFNCRPSGLSEPSGFVFGARGRRSPNPRVNIRLRATPRAANHSLTALARRSDNL